MPDRNGNPVDYSRDVILRMAQEAVDNAADRGHRAEVYFKFTCAHCGTRCTLADANKLYEYGECNSCGHSTEITEAGFSFVEHLREEPPDEGPEEDSTPETPDAS